MAKTGSTLTVILISALVLTSIPIIICSGCLVLTEKGISAAKTKSESKRAEMPLEKVAFLDLQVELEKDAIKFKRYFQEWMTERLKFPKTAEFDLSANAAESDGHRVVVVTGTIASENSLGTKSRKKVTGIYLDKEIIHFEFENDGFSEADKLQKARSVIDEFQKEKKRLVD